MLAPVKDSEESDDESDCSLPEELNESDEQMQSQPLNLKEHHQYPPIGQTLDKMITYLCTKVIPPLIPQDVCNEVQLTGIRKIAPFENHCQICPSHPPLNKELLITQAGKLLTLQGLIEG